MKFIIEQSDEHLTPVAGLALVGEILNHTALKYRFNKATRVYLLRIFLTGMLSLPTSACFAKAGAILTILSSIGMTFSLPGHWISGMCLRALPCAVGPRCR